MSQPIQAHSYGPGCQLAQHVPIKEDNDIPQLKCQFFYSSRIGIDDPLSAVPVPGTTPVQHPPRPFSAYDNAALDYAWMRFSVDAKGGAKDKEDEGAPVAMKETEISTFEDIHPEQEELVMKVAGLEPSDRQLQNMSKEDFGYESVSDHRSEKSMSISESRLGRSIAKGSPAGRSHANQNISSSRTTRTNELKGKGTRQSTSGGGGFQDSLPEAGQYSQSARARARAATLTEPDSPRTVESVKKENSSVKRSRSVSQRRQRISSLPNEIDLLGGEPSSLPAYNHNTTITGQPFLRLPSRRGVQTSTQASVADLDFESEQDDDGHSSGQENEQKSVRGHFCKAKDRSEENVHVPVGASRLHHVQLPQLIMKPIYWSPAHDIAAVIRGSWFHADTMLPVDVDVANQLEMGYRELRVWSQTWSDELKSATEVGAEAEEKLAHQLWKKEDEQKSTSGKMTEHTLSTDRYCAAMCFHGEAAAEGTIDPASKEPNIITKRYPNSQVIYKDSQNAFILKPALQPSAYYGRRPLQKIKRGQTVGLHVVRGWSPQSQKLWDQLHPSEKSSSAAKAESNAPVAVETNNQSTDCKACKHEEERPKVSDVVFVIHGIGQKLSERMESFNFTHAINSFRRSMNLEMSHKDVQKVLRPDLGGIMVLPINWRTNFKMEESEDESLAHERFSLDSITQKSIPAVRNMISDVMLDIPFYMSQHKPRMVRAVVAEANRVYRLWCQNNPNFHKEGRVHLIAHSLGTAMAMDILSEQPTLVPDFDPLENRQDAQGERLPQFNFNTTNLFMCGSPAGFFLYLEKAMLTPRRGQNKVGAEATDDQDKNLVNEAGTYGCLATENLYNIMAVYDPIAYQLNAAVDSQYAASLKTAKVPNTTVGFFENLGNVVRRKPSTDPTAAKPLGMKRLPSQLEMDVHDFTREEIAEKKFNLLNDNGQLDWVLSSGGGPLENQYINMLGAHSSYWESQDFVRFIVVEVGRKAGKEHALPYMKAVKAGAIKIVQKSSS